MKLFVGTKGIVHHEGKILLLRESSAYVDGSDAGKWDVPGGRIESDETLSQGLLREIKEECGLDVEQGRVLGAFDGFPVIRGEDCHVVRIYYACKALHTRVVLSSDHDSYEWVSPDSVTEIDLMDDIAEMIAEFKKTTL